MLWSVWSAGQLRVRLCPGARFIVSGSRSPISTPCTTEREREGGREGGGGGRGEVGGGGGEREGEREREREREGEAMSILYHSILNVQAPRECVSVHRHI